MQTLPALRRMFLREDFGSYFIACQRETSPDVIANFNQNSRNVKCTPNPTFVAILSLMIDVRDEDVQKRSVMFSALPILGSKKQPEALSLSRHFFEAVVCQNAIVIDLLSAGWRPEVRPACGRCGWWTAVSPGFWVSEW